VDPNVLGGFMSAYFVITALTTVRPVSGWTRRLESGAIVLALALALIEIGLGVKAFASPMVRSTVPHISPCLFLRRSQRLPPSAMFA
jgi:hypothetical protein